MEKDRRSETGIRRARIPGRARYCIEAWSTRSRTDFSPEIQVLSHASWKVKAPSYRRSYAFLFPRSQFLHVVVSTCNSPFHSQFDHPRHRASGFRSTGRYTTCLLPLRRSAHLPRAAKYNVDSLLAYTRAAVEDVPNVFICIYVVLLPLVSTLNVTLIGETSLTVVPPTMDKTKHDEVMQLEDTGDALVCLPTRSRLYMS